MLATVLAVVYPGCASAPASGAILDAQQEHVSWDFLPSIQNVTREVTNRCSSFDLAQFTTARDCGSPLASPCFDFSRCRDGPSIYVYDPEVSRFGLFGG